MTSPKCSICVWTHSLNVSIKYFNVVHFKRQGYKGWWILCRKYLRRTEKWVIKWTHNLKQRYSWKQKQKRKETAAARRHAWSLPFPHTCWTAHTMKRANSVSPQKPEPGLDLGQLQYGSCTYSHWQRGSHSPNTQTWAHWHSCKWRQEVSIPLLLVQ